MNPSPNLFIIGPTGAGKTSIGAELASRFNMRFVDLDAVIEQAAGTSINAIFADEGEAGFRKRESAALREQADGIGLVLATGGGVVLDAANRKLLAQRGFVLWLDATVEQQLERLAQVTDRPLLDGVERPALLQAMMEKRGPHYAATADLHIEGADETLEQGVGRVVGMVARVYLRLTPKP